jgi:hypothetical protein
MTALPWPRTELVPLIFDVFLDFWPKGDYNDHNHLEGRLPVSCPGCLSAAPSPCFQDKGQSLSVLPPLAKKKAALFGATRWSGAWPPLIHLGRNSPFSVIYLSP